MSLMLPTFFSFFKYGALTLCMFWAGLQELRHVPDMFRNHTFQDLVPDVFQNHTFQDLDLIHEVFQIKDPVLDVFQNPFNNIVKQRCQKCYDVVRLKRYDAISKINICRNCLNKSLVHHGKCEKCLKKSLVHHGKCENCLSKSLFHHGKRENFLNKSLVHHGKHRDYLNKSLVHHSKRVDYLNKALVHHRKRENCLNKSLVHHGKRGHYLNKSLVYHGKHGDCLNKSMFHHSKRRAVSTNLWFIMASAKTPSKNSWSINKASNCFIKIRQVYVKLDAPSFAANRRKPSIAFTAASLLQSIGARHTSVQSYSHPHWVLAH
ncbi:hypothetical protein Lal_00033925 [Lupinus albus]|nr:hypothetical protein Lal_00033925 [Lupinus albus]